MYRWVACLESGSRGAFSAGARAGGAGAGIASIASGVYHLRLCEDVGETGCGAMISVKAGSASSSESSTVRDRSVGGLGEVCKGATVSTCKQGRPAVYHCER